MDTPLMRQYYSIKEKYMDQILLFRMGDFYEMFDDDAIEVSAAVGITLTKRVGSTMCGIPCKSYDVYINKILRTCARQIAICEQIETPEEAKAAGRSIVLRDVVKIVSRGTFIDITNPNNNFILAVTKDKDQYSFCYYDMGTGECFYASSTWALLKSTISKIDCSEIISDFFFESDKPIKIIQFKKYDLPLQTLKEAMKEYVGRMGYSFDPVSIGEISFSSYLKTNESTIRNLEIFQDSDGKLDNSLFGLLDYTKTAMGKRALKNNLANPLCVRSTIEQKQNCVQYFIERYINEGHLKLAILDISKMLHRMSSIKELRQTCENIQVSMSEIDLIVNSCPKYLREKCDCIKNFVLHLEILKNIDSAEDRDYFNSEECKKYVQEKNLVLEEMFRLPEKYGVNCRVKDNEFSGYFFETNRKVVVPDFFIKIRDLQNSIRYTTKDLLDLQDKLVSIESNLELLEKQLFDDWKKKLYSQRHVVEQISALIGEIDYFQSCAVVSLKRNYTRPTFVNRKCFIVDSGKHPTISARRENYIENNTALGVENPGKNYPANMYLITGPNMGGKSTYLRQNAIFVIMSHCGMFVPCRSLTTSVFDCLFVRVGSGDNLAENKSTFMVEMQRCAEMIENSTEDSFLVLDEVGRGTSTKDGVSISCAMLEHIHDSTRCLAIVSTHYLEMAKMLQALPYLHCKRMKIISSPLKFLYSIEDGVVDESFGIEVARMAGMNKAIVDRSEKILSSMKLSIDIFL